VQHAVITQAWVHLHVYAACNKIHRTKVSCTLFILQIGRHFSKWGRVMDVVMVKDFGPLLSLAETATNLEQQRKAAESKPAHGKRAGRSTAVWNRR
jgi:hypothetical protein